MTCTKLNCPLQIGFVSENCDKKDCPYRTELKTGNWVEGRYYYELDIFEWEKVKCSICEKYTIKPVYYHNNKYNYCPFCGAKME